MKRTPPEAVEQSAASARYCSSVKAVKISSWRPRRRRSAHRARAKWLTTFTGWRGVRFTLARIPKLKTPWLPPGALPKLMDAGIQLHPHPVTGSGRSDTIPAPTAVGPAAKPAVCRRWAAITAKSPGRKKTSKVGGSGWAMPPACRARSASSKAGYAKGVGVEVMRPRGLGSGRPCP